MKDLKALQSSTIHLGVGRKLIHKGDSTNTALLGINKYIK